MPRRPGENTSHAAAAISNTSPSGYALQTPAVSASCVPAAVGTTRNCHTATAAAVPKIAPSRIPSRTWRPGAQPRHLVETEREERVAREVEARRPATRRAGPGRRPRIRPTRDRRRPKRSVRGRRTPTGDRPSGRAGRDRPRSRPRPRPTLRLRPGRPRRSASASSGRRGPELRRRSTKAPATHCASRPRLRRVREPG